MDLEERLKIRDLIDNYINNVAYSNPSDSYPLFPRDFEIKKMHSLYLN